jgi:hypothetical protein
MKIVNKQVISLVGILATAFAVHGQSTNVTPVWVDIGLSNETFVLTLHGTESNRTYQV